MFLIDPDFSIHIFPLFILYNGIFQKNIKKNVLKNKWKKLFYIFDTKIPTIVKNKILLSWYASKQTAKNIYNNIKTTRKGLLISHQHNKIKKASCRLMEFI